MRSEKEGCRNGESETACTDLSLDVYSGVCQCVSTGMYMFVFASVNSDYDQ